MAGAVEFYIYVPVTAVHQVLQGLRFLGRGTVLKTNSEEEQLKKDPSSPGRWRLIYLAVA